MSAIERLYPNWQKFRDIAGAIEWHTDSQDKVIADLRRQNDSLRQSLKQAD